MRIILLALLLVGCGKKADAPAKEAPKDEPKPAAAAKPTETKPEPKAEPPPEPPKPADPAPAKPAGTTLGDQLETSFVKLDAGGVIAVFKITNNTPCTVESYDYRGYAYDKAGKKVGGATGGGGLGLAPGKSVEREIRVNGKQDSIAEMVVTGVKCADGKTWEDNDRAPFDRPMGGKK